MNPPLDRLLEAEQLLRAYDNPHQADLVKALRENLERRGTAAYETATGGDWWGGSGSVADVSFYRIGLVTDDARVRIESDNRQLKRALLAVLESMKQSGFNPAGAETWVKAWKVGHAI